MKTKYTFKMEDVDHRNFKSEIKLSFDDQDGIDAIKTKFMCFLLACGWSEQVIKDNLLIEDE